jgi:ketosteroid isomerase-like protein
MPDDITNDNPRTSRKQFHEYIKTKNIEGITSLYTENASLMANKEPTFKGKTKIKEFYTYLFKEGVEEVSLNPVEIIDSGDIVAEKGSVRILLKTAGEVTLDVIEKYIILWKRTPEGYKIHWDMFNSNS